MLLQEALLACTAANSRFLVGEQGNQQKAPLCLRDQKIWRKRMVGEVLLYCILLFFVLGKSLHRSQLWTAERERADVILRFISPWFLSSQAASPPHPPIFFYSHRERRIPNQRGEQRKRGDMKVRDSSTHIQELMKRAPPIEIAAVTYQTNGKRCVTTLASSWLENDRPGNKRCTGQPVSVTA